MAGTGTAAISGGQTLGCARAAKDGGGPSVAAYFDVDGTLAATNSVTPLLWSSGRAAD